MDCRHSIVVNNMWFFAMVHTKADYHHGIPKRELFNPLRYEVHFRKKKSRFDYKTLFKVNTDGMWHIKVSNFIYHIKKFISK